MCLYINYKNTSEWPSFSAGSSGASFAFAEYQDQTLINEIFILDCTPLSSGSSPPTIQLTTNVPYQSTQVPFFFVVDGIQAGESIAFNVSNVQSLESFSFYIQVSDTMTPPNVSDSIEVTTSGFVTFTYTTSSTGVPVWTSTSSTPST